jgi:tetratricopeptide (TPR) repeat protein
VSDVVILYDQGLFQEAELLALRTLQGADSLAPVDRSMLHRILGFTYVAMGENEKAKNQFMAWLDLDPLAELDSVYISPKIVTVFREAKAEHQQRIRDLRKAETLPTDLRREATARSLIFPGLGQIHAGYKTKGYSLVASEALLLGTIVYCQLQYDVKRDDYLSEHDPDRMQDLYDDANSFYRARNASIGLAAGVYLFSLYDALHLPPQKRGGESLSISYQLRLGQLLSLTWRF